MKKRIGILCLLTVLLLGGCGRGNDEPTNLDEGYTALEEERFDDAIASFDTAIAEVEGRTAAQIMLICGADKGGNLPNFEKNLGFAAAWQDAMESRYPGLTRPVLLDYRYYNQDLTTGSLLIEVGSHGNTLEQAVYSGQLAGQALAELLRQQAGA